MVTSAPSVESNVSRGGRSGRGASGAFTSAAEVWDTGWKVLAASGCRQRSLFKPILSVTAGRRRASEANRGDGGKINGAAGDRPMFPLTALLLCIPQLDPVWLIAPDFLSPRANVCPVSSSSRQYFLLDSPQLNVEHLYRSCSAASPVT